MAKKENTETIPQNLQQAAERGTPNTAAPKKARRKGVKYTNIVESTYKPPEDGKPQNPLDMKCKTVKGGLKFPGVVFENTIFGAIVKIPGKAVAIKEPTVRQLIEVLEDLYK